MTKDESEAAWVIERDRRYWDGRGAETFHYDHLQALRFARAEDAERALSWLVAESVKAECKVTQHLWLCRASFEIAAAPASPAPAKESATPSAIVSAEPSASVHGGLGAGGAATPSATQVPVSASGNRPAAERKLAATRDMTPHPVVADPARYTQVGSGMVKTYKRGTRVPSGDYVTSKDYDKLAAALRSKVADPEQPSAALAELARQVDHVAFNIAEGSSRLGLTERSILKRAADALRSVEPAPRGEQDAWLLQDSRTMVGNDVMFWAAGGGYTTDVSKAQRFSKQEAEQQHRCRDTDLPWPVDYIMSKARPAVDFQYLDRARIAREGKAT